MSLEPVPFGLAEIMTDEAHAKMIADMQRELDEARYRQENPGAYALLQANGMKWPQLVALIGADALLVDACREDEW